MPFELAPSTQRRYDSERDDALLFRPFLSLRDPADATRRARFSEVAAWFPLLRERLPPATPAKRRRVTHHAGKPDACRDANVVRCVTLDHNAK